MSIRLPLQGVLTAIDTNDVGAGSVNGGVAFPFTIPQDTDNIVVKLTASIVGGGVSAYLQTTDDGGTTYYDVARTSVVSNANNTTAEWLSIPVISSGVTTISETANSSIVSNATIGSAAASTLGVKTVSGLPILSTQGRIFLQYSAGVSANALTQAVVKVNSQSARQ
jgi:hypothetical protein